MNDKHFIVTVKDDPVYTAIVSEHGGFAESINFARVVQEAGVECTVLVNASHYAALRAAAILAIETIECGFPSSAKLCLKRIVKSLDKKRNRRS